MARRVLRALTLAWCIATLAFPLAIHAVPFEASQAQFLQDCQTTWSRTFDGWSASNTDCSSAHGISCDLSGMVVKLSLNYNQVEGPVPSSISNLRELVDLDLSYNFLSGPIPTELFTLTKLTNLQLYYNHFTDTIPSAIGMLTNLASMNFANNKLTGSIPSEISKLTALSTLSIAPNYLNGSIPDGISMLTKLTYLRGDTGLLTGSIPAGIGNLKKLQTLWLDNNLLDGSIPASLSSLTAMTKLRLNSNNLAGNIYFLSNFTNLVFLHMDSNTNLNGNIYFVSTFTKLNWMYLNNNQFSGSIPSAISKLRNLLYADLSNNYFSGPVAGLPWLKLILNSNYLAGSLDTSISNYSTFSGNCFTQSMCPRTLPNCPLGQQRTATECAAFCGGVNPCDGNGICYPDGPSLVPTCLCQPGYVLVGRFNCFAQGWNQSLFISKRVLPLFTILTTGTQKQTAGKFMATPTSLFAYSNPRSTGCGVELAFSAIFTFCLVSDDGPGGTNGFAFVIAANSKLGKVADGVGYDGMAPRSIAIEFDTIQNAKYNDIKEQHVGLNINGSEKSVAAVDSPFTLNNGEYYTAWVDYDPWNGGSIKVFLADSKEKPEQPLLQSNLSLCAVLQPSVQQSTFFVGFVASTSVKPFQMHAILNSTMRTEMRPPPKPVDTTSLGLGLTISENSLAPPEANLFSRYVSTDYQWTGNSVSVDSWAIRDFQNWGSMAFLSWPVKDQLDCSACWAYAVVASVEAAYGIALNQAAPQLSVESLFAAMGLTDADKCTAGGSPTAALEKLVTLDASSGLTGGSNPAKPYPVAAFERALFKGYFGLMLAVRRQPVVVHIEASADTFFQYDGTFKYQDPACYTGNLNHVVLVVGYFINRDDGSQNRISPPFWIIRNSWGAGWGDGGHMRMDIQGGDGVCGINVLPGIYPIVKIPGDPCSNNSYKGDQDPNGMNPCGRFPCQKVSESYTCTCTIRDAAVQPFVNADNGNGFQTCAYVDVCGSYFKNPCYVGSCINDGKGSYSCICPPNYVERVTLYGFPTCDPANSTATNMTVSGDNWQCADVSPLVGIPIRDFMSNNVGIDCDQPLPKGTVIQLAGAPEKPCTAFFYALKGETCSYINARFGFGATGLSDLNPGLYCSPRGLDSGQSVCIERSSAYAYTVPECLKYGTLTSLDTCEGLLQKTAGSSWADLYRNNPGLTCSSTIPRNFQVQVCLRADYWPFTASVVCKKGKSKKVDVKDSCSTVMVTGRFTSSAQFAEYNGKICSGTVGSRSICVPV
ncbi:unnamed protein product [Closterium sp. Yama58-4]|nr:unnamed protein product [Closterium sp. Yama58-4]